MYLVFVDFEKAFDSLNREAIWGVMKQYGVPGKIVKLLKALDEDFSFQVEHQSELSETFPAETAVWQRCLLSPIIFLLVLDEIMRRTVKK